MKILSRVPEYIQNIVPYDPGKPIEEVERELGIKASLKMASNENPLGPSKKAVEAIKDYADRVSRYPDGMCYYLKNAISEHMGVSPENIIVGNGSNEIIELLIRTYLIPGENIVMGWPSFVVYSLISQTVGASAKRVYLTDDYKHDVDGILKVVDKDTRIVFIDNPNNPTGTCLCSSDVMRILNSLPSDVLLVLDEAYAEYADADCAGGIEIFKKYHADNLVLLRTFSKLYGLAGLRIGYGIANPHVIKYLNKVRQPFNVNALAQVAAIAALSDDSHVEKSLLVNKEGKEFLYASFKKMGLSFVPSFTNFVLVDVGYDSKLVFNKLLKRGIIVRAMHGYGLPCHIRVTVGLLEHNKRFIEALNSVLLELSS